MKSTGDTYEEAAAQLLLAEGLEIVERNFSTKVGEIDIIAKDQNQLIFVEVRSRSNRYFAGAAASVNRRKQQRLIKTAQWYLQRRPQWANLPCRFDVIAFEPPQSGPEAQVRWIKGAFTT